MISVVMPAHNEQGYLEAAVKTVVTGLRDRAAEFEVIVAENGSVDGSSVESDHLADLYREVEVVHLADADYGRALRAGFLASHGEIVTNFDVDFVDLGFLDRALEIMQDDSVAVVVGSKKAPGSDDQRSAGRKLVTTVFTLMLRRGFGLGVSDTHGIKSMRRDALLPVVGSCIFGKDIYDTEVVLRAERAGLTIKEIPVSVIEVRPARTSIVRRIPRSLLGLARLRIALWRAGPG